MGHLCFRWALFVVCFLNVVFVQRMFNTWNSAILVSAYKQIKCNCQLNQHLANFVQFFWISTIQIRIQMSKQYILIHSLLDLLNKIRILVRNSKFLMILQTITSDLDVASFKFLGMDSKSLKILFPSVPVLRNFLTRFVFFIPIYHYCTCLPFVGVMFWRKKK